MQDLKTPVSGGVRAKLQRYWTSPEVYTSTLLMMFLDAFPDKDEDGRIEALDWHPETVLMEVEETFGITLPAYNYHRLMAGITLLTTDLFFKDVKKFIDLVNVMAFDEFTPDQFNPADVYECAWAIYEATLLVPPSDEDGDDIFSDEIRRYIGVRLEEEGFIDPPDILRIALAPDRRAFVHQQYSDDPVMFDGVYANQKSRNEGVENMLIDNFEKLAEQLEGLPLSNGSTAPLVASLRSLIAEKRKKTPVDDTDKYLDI